jgi:hypothetical protein
MNKTKYIVLACLMTACASNPIVDLSDTQSEIKIFRDPGAIQTQNPHARALGDIEVSATEFGQAAALAEAKAKLVAQLQKVGAQYLFLRESSSSYNLWTAKTEVILRGTAYSANK